MCDFKRTSTLMLCGVMGTAGCGDDFAAQGGGGGLGAGGAAVAGGAVGGAGAGGSSGGTGGSGGGGTVIYEFLVKANIPFEVGSLPLEGAGVAIDLMDGSRVEGLSDAAGRVFIDVPIEADPDRFIVHRDGYAFVSSSLRMDEELNRKVILHQNWTSGLQVSGDVSNMTDPAGGRLEVRATPGGIFTSAGSSAYDLLVPPSKDFTLSATELSYLAIGQDLSVNVDNYWVTQGAPLSAPALIDIDFAAPTPASTPIAFSLVPPSDAALESSGLAAFSGRSTKGLMGTTSQCTHNAQSGRFDCSGAAYDNGANIDSVMYVVGDESWLAGDGYGRGAFAMVPGLVSGAINVGFVNPPVRAAPSGPGPHPVDTVVSFELPPGGSDHYSVVGRISAPSKTRDPYLQRSGERLIGVVGPYMGELRVPELPSSSNSEAHYAPSMDYMIHTCGLNCDAQSVVVWEASPPQP